MNKFARAASRGVMQPRRQSKRNDEGVLLNEREAWKIEDDRFTKVDGMWRLKKTQTWKLSTRFGTVTLRTVTGGQDKIVRTKRGKRKFYAWVQIQDSLTIPQGISQAEFNSQLGSDLWAGFSKPASYTKHLNMENKEPTLPHGREILSRQGKLIGFGVKHGDYVRKLAPLGKRSMI